MYTVYILLSKTTGQYYIGQTKDITKRFLWHNSGYSLSTKSGIPWDLVFQEHHPDHSSAVKRETQLKKMKSKILLDKLVLGRASR